MSEMIYLVQGNSGEYADYTEWCEGAYRTEEEAKTRIEQFKMICLAANLPFGSRVKDYDEIREIEELLETHPLGDPNVRVDYTGIDYKVVPVPLRRY